MLVDAGLCSEAAVRGRQFDAGMSRDGLNFLSLAGGSLPNSRSSARPASVCLAAEGGEIPIASLRELGDLVLRSELVAASRQLLDRPGKSFNRHGVQPLTGAPSATRPRDPTRGGVSPRLAADRHPWIWAETARPYTTPPTRVRLRG